MQFAAASAAAFSCSSITLSRFAISVSNIFICPLITPSSSNNESIVTIFVFVTTKSDKIVDISSSKPPSARPALILAWRSLILTSLPASLSFLNCSICVETNSLTLSCSSSVISFWASIASSNDFLISSLNFSTVSLIVSADVLSASHCAWSSAFFSLLASKSASSAVVASVVWASSAPLIVAFNSPASVWMSASVKPLPSTWYVSPSASVNVKISSSKEISTPPLLPIVLPLAFVQVVYCVAIESIVITNTFHLSKSLMYI